MKLLFALLITVGLGAVIGFSTRSNISTWYTDLQKPVYFPTKKLIAPVWTILYILMGIALYLIWDQNPSPQRSIALTLFFIQLALNFFWSFLFFNFHLMGIALLDILLLVIFIILCINSFSKMNEIAAWLFVPYLAWVGFASLLNFSIWRLNR